MGLLLEQITAIFWFEPGRVQIDSVFVLGIVGYICTHTKVGPVRGKAHIDGVSR